MDEDLMFDFVVEIASGVEGYTVDLGEKGLYIPLVQATDPGNGDVGRFIDGLPTDRRIVFPNVINGKLEGMLKRRGYVEEHEWSEDFGEMVPLLVKLPISASTQIGKQPF